MITSFLSVAQQVLILFILLMIGFICTKAKFFTEDCISGIAKFLLYTADFTLYNILTEKCTIDKELTRCLNLMSLN